MQRKTLSGIVLAGLVVGGVAPMAEADFLEPQSWTRGAGGTTYQAWDSFDAYPVDSTPDSSINGNGTASLEETSGSAFITSGGNIYSFSGATSFVVTIPEADVPVPAHDLTAIVQIETLGTELDASTLLLNGVSPSAGVELYRESLGGFGGAGVENWFLFEVPYASFGSGAPGVAELLLTFSASGSSMSLAGLSIDTAVRPFGFYAEPVPAPEPASAVLMGLAAVLGLRRV